MKVIDLSHFINKDMPVFPGAAQPELIPAMTFEQYGFVETMLHMMSHTGTHVDAPSHMLKGAPSLDDYSISKFFGLALIIDHPLCAGPKIELKPLQQMSEKIGRAEFVLFNTTHSRKWGAEDYFNHFPLLTPEAAKFLTSFSLKGIGVDAISFDELMSETSPIHHILLSSGLILIENLTNLNGVKGEYCMFAALPLKYKNADGSPVRAIAIEMAKDIY
ncbi:MAG: cyclase family protein [Firmicutes bacterium]|nr:cyclase family protein [Bacillota bacterium]